MAFEKTLVKIPINRADSHALYLKPRGNDYIYTLDLLKHGLPFYADGTDVATETLSDSYAELNGQDLFVFIDYDKAHQEFRGKRTGVFKVVPETLVEMFNIPKEVNVLE